MQMALILKLEQQIILIKTQVYKVYKLDNDRLLLFYFRHLIDAFVQLEDNFDHAEEELIRILKIISTRYLWGHFIIYNILSVCIFKYNEILWGFRKQQT